MEKETRDKILDLAEQTATSLFALQSFLSKADLIDEDTLKIIKKFKEIKQQYESLEKTIHKLVFD